MLRFRIKICELELSITSIWLTSLQVSWLLRNFPVEDFIRIEALIAVFGKILDLENFHHVLAVLEPWEREEIIHRLGCMNVCDGVHPAMTYDLHLDVYEDRQICKVRGVGRPERTGCCEGHHRRRLTQRQQACSC